MNRNRAKHSNFYKLCKSCAKFDVGISMEIPPKNPTEIQLPGCKWEMHCLMSENSMQTTQEAIKSSVQYLASIQVASCICSQYSYKEAEIEN